MASHLVSTISCLVQHEGVEGALHSAHKDVPVLKFYQGPREDIKKNQFNLWWEMYWTPGYCSKHEAILPLRC